MVLIDLHLFIGLLLAFNNGLIILFGFKTFPTNTQTGVLEQQITYPISFNKNTFCVGSHANYTGFAVWNISVSSCCLVINNEWKTNNTDRFSYIIFGY